MSGFNVRYVSTQCAWAALVCAMASGCGGGGNSAAVQASYVGSYKGTANITSGPHTGQLAVDLVIGSTGAAAFGSDSGSGPFPCLVGTANLGTGAVTLNQVSEQLSGTVSVSIQLAPGGGSGTITASGSDGTSTGTVSFSSVANVTSPNVGGYLGTMNLTSGPDTGASWPIQLFVANDGVASGSTYDPGGDGFSYDGTVNFATNAVTLAVHSASDSLSGVTGTLSETISSATTITGTVSLSNGDAGSVALTLKAP